MKAEDKIKLLGIKLYIQLILLDKNILSKIKIKFDEKKINFLYNNYKKFFYQISEAGQFSQFQIMKPLFEYVLRHQPNLVQQ